MSRSDEEERRFLSTGVAALVTLPEATGDLLEDGAGASPDLERVMVNDASESRENGAQQNGQRKKREKTRETKQKQATERQATAEQKKAKKNGEANQAKTKVTAEPLPTGALRQWNCQRCKDRRISYRNRFPKY
jgi:DNA-directed RNA polymerase subunit M/transcription elongation factor TFIIS